jgi:hypothetical protein
VFNIIIYKEVTTVSTNALAQCATTKAHSTVCYTRKKKCKFIGFQMHVVDIHIQCRQMIKKKNNKEQ